MPRRSRMKKDSIESVFIGIDNGVTGSIGVIKMKGGNRTTSYIKTPVFKEQDYTKKKKKISRVMTNTIYRYLKDQLKDVETENIHVMMERPMVNPGRFVSTVSALRSMEAILVVIENMKLSREWIDSKEWQKKLLPKGCEGTDLKDASVTIGSRLFPEHEITIISRGDADGILIAEYCRRYYT